MPETRKRRQVPSTGSNRKPEVIDMATPAKQSKKSYSQSEPSSSKSAKDKTAKKKMSEAEKIQMYKGDKKDDFEFFWGKDSSFSQFYPAKFTLDDTKYNCAEQYMMHQKAVVFKDEKMAKEIMKTDKPVKQKKFGRKVQNFDPTVWSNMSVDIVKRGNIAKFSQNDDLKKKLLKTHPKILVEASPRDRIWGIGLSAKNEKAWNRATWRGRNLLGYALSDVRKQLMEDL